MEQEINKKAEEFMSGLANKAVRATFLSGLTFNIIGYIGITFLLNSIREHSSIWLVWTLIVIQIFLYFWIFTKCYMYIIGKGFNKNIAFIIELVLVILGRVNDWELLAIPCIVLISLIIPRKTKVLL